MLMRIVHLTTVHPARDTRILIREAASLAGPYDDVTLIANGEDSFTHDGVDVVGLYADTPGLARRLADASRLLRPLVSQLVALRLLARIRPAVVHGHDPELLPLLVALRATGRRVVFDCHEHLGRQMRKKPYLGRWGPTVGRLLDGMLAVSARLLSATVVAHPWQYPNLPRRVVLRNLPTIEDLPPPEPPDDRQPMRLIYVGRIEVSRGAVTMLDLVHSLRTAGDEVTLTLVGEAHPTMIETLEQHPGWDATEWHGPLPWKEAMGHVAEADVGLFLAERTPAYDLSESTKVYEYLALGLPALVTDMEVYRQLEAEHPDLSLIVVSAEAPEWPTADELREAGKAARAGMEEVRRQFAWATEERKLLSLYKTLEPR